MVWAYNIDDLEYYNANGFWPCYEEPLFIPHDLLLQIALPRPTGSSGFSIVIKLLTPDGLTVYSTITSNFDYFFAYVTLRGINYYYCNIRLNSYATDMTAHGCFILQVTVTDIDSTQTVFEAYTQRYSLLQTAAPPGGVTVIPEGQGNIATLCASTSGLDLCGRQYLKFAAIFDCFDSFNGDYYGDATNVLAGVGSYPFSHIRQSNINGRLKKLPREIKRTISINCRTQKTETTPKYSLLGDTVFPIWKVNEIESMMLANHLYVNGKEYQSGGGTPFTQFGKPQSCQYTYQLNMELEDCYRFQIFECSSECSSQTYYYPVTIDNVPFFDDTKRLVAQNITALVTYLASLPDMVSVTSVPFQLPCQLAAVIQVKSAGSPPKYLHQQFAIPSARIYPKILPENTGDLSSLCGAMPLLSCPDPVLGIPVSFTSVCPDPVLGVPTSISDAFSYNLVITGENGWVVQAYTAANINGLVTFTLLVINNSYTDNAIQNYVNQTIGVISNLGRPITAALLTHDNNADLDPNNSIAILPTGEIQFSGPAMYQDMTGSQIVLPSLSYFITLTP